MGKVVRFKGPRLWHILGLAEAFGLNWHQARARLRPVPPDGTLRGKPAWLMQNAAPAILYPTLASPRRASDLDDMEPRDRLDWIRSERELFKLREEVVELIPADEVEKGLDCLLSMFTQAAVELPDSLARDVELTPDQYQAIRDHCTALRAKLSEVEAGAEASI